MVRFRSRDVPIRYAASSKCGGVSGGPVGGDGGGKKVGDAVLDLADECGRHTQACGDGGRGFAFLKCSPDIGIARRQGDVVQYVLPCRPPMGTIVNG